MASTFSNSGSQRVTGDSVLGASGKAVRIFNISAAGVGGSEIVLRNGTDATGDIYLQLPTSDSPINFEEGLLLPDGCFYDHAGSSFAVVSFRNENS